MRRTTKFDRKRTEVVNIASEQINIFGAGGMTLTAVAKQLGVDTSSVTYYFPKKDQLVAACLERTNQWSLEAAREAARKATPRDRVRALLAAYFELHRRQRDPDVPRLAVQSDISSLEGAVRAPIDRLFREAVSNVRGFFDAPPGEAGRIARAARATALLSVLYWMPAWIDRYLVEDLTRAEDRLFAMLDQGLAAGAWSTGGRVLHAHEPRDAQERFLYAATDQINLRGYRGASVAGIAASLGVSIGSFYHHLDNKDDLVVACFERNFGLMGEARRQAAEAAATAGDRLGLITDLLLSQQFKGPCPLLRISAYQALPPELRKEMLDRTARETRHLAGLIADGIADGSIRATDPAVAGDAIMAMIDGAVELRRWAAPRPLSLALQIYGGVLRHGLFTPIEEDETAYALLQADA